MITRPLSLDLPWHLREGMTYLHAQLFQGTIYCACCFALRQAGPQA